MYAVFCDAVLWSNQHGSLTLDPSNEDKGMDVLTDPTKKIFQSSNYILQIWRRFLSSEDVGVSKWNNLVLNHILKLRQIRPMSPQAVGTERGNLKKALLQKESMSIGALTKGMGFLGFTKFKFTVTGYRPDGTEVSHSVMVPCEQPKMFESTPSDGSNVPTGETKPEARTPADLADIIARFTPPPTGVPPKPEE